MGVNEAHRHMELAGDIDRSSRAAAIGTWERDASRSGEELGEQLRGLLSRAAACASFFAPAVLRDDDDGPRPRLHLKLDGRWTHAEQNHERPGVGRRLQQFYDATSDGSCADTRAVQAVLVQFKHALAECTVDPTQPVDTLEFCTDGVLRAATVAPDLVEFRTRLTAADRSTGLEQSHGPRRLRQNESTDVSIREDRVASAHIFVGDMQYRFGTRSQVTREVSLVLEANASLPLASLSQ